MLFVSGTVTVETNQTTSTASIPGTQVVRTQAANNTPETETLRKTGHTETTDSPLPRPSIRPLQRTVTKVMPEIAVRGESIS